MIEPPAERPVSLPSRPTPGWAYLVGLALPLGLIAAAALLVPADAGRLLGISLASWCLFACAPVTSACLALCWHLTGGASDETRTDTIDDGEG
ncbi:hypothetical protein MTR62_16325 [Novosphingobium sp. 1949]|uniref:DUF3311 domain-containing protein n=1 Tax=Novosphingobium organovorum TaxID=2930092 RepID=A0ABT0BHP8_9SPHN|nr:hypothetical protein [Novosphingobium organovorum]MCJ2184244.1 hypothetical protein [Novosphingobium organovorum]